MGSAGDTGQPFVWRFHHRDGSHSHLQLVVPVRLRSEILQDLHASAVSAHLGQRKTLSQLRLRFYWPGQTTDAKTWCCTCSVCSARKTPSPKQHAHLHTIGAGYPMQVVAVDILGPLPESPSGNKHILVAVDYFTRWAAAYEIPNQETVTVATSWWTKCFSVFPHQHSCTAIRVVSLSPPLRQKFASCLEYRQQHITHKGMV